MRLPRLPHVDTTEAALRITGVALAGGSVVFAAHMVGRSDRDPQIIGIEHLAIYARPATSASMRPRVARSENIDYTPVSSIRGGFPTTTLTDFELIEASSVRATIRTPLGRVTQVTPGARLSGIGEVVSIAQRNGKWIVTTQSGIICER